MNYKLPKNWMPYNTGGGCMALAAKIDDNRQWLITIIDDVNIPQTDTEPCLLGIESESNEQIYWNCSNIYEAFFIASKSFSV
jgi:hypothetical protein